MADWILLPHSATVHSSSSHVKHMYLNGLWRPINPSPTGRQRDFILNISALYCPRQISSPLHCSRRCRRFPSSAKSALWIKASPLVCADGLLARHMGQARGSRCQWQSEDRNRPKGRPVFAAAVQAFWLAIRRWASQRAKSPKAMPVTGQMTSCGTATNGSEETRKSLTTNIRPSGTPQVMMP